MDNNEDMLRLERYCELDQFDEAIRHLDRLIDNNCEYLEEALVFVVFKLNENKNFFDKAYHLIRKGLILFPENKSLKIEMCLNLQLRGFQKEALTMCRQLSEEYPSSVKIWYTLAELYSDYGDYEKAIESIDYALACEMDNDKNSEVIYQLKLLKGLFLFKNGSYYPAIDCLLDLMSHDEYIKTEIDPCLAECYMRINEFETALDLLNGLIGQQGIEDEIAFLGNLIYCCMQTGRQIVAFDILTDTIKKYPYMLHYLSTLQYFFNYQAETDIGDHKIIHSSELVQKFFSNINLN